MPPLWLWLHTSLSFTREANHCNWTWLFNTVQQDVQLCVPSQMLQYIGNKRREHEMCANSHPVFVNKLKKVIRGIRTSPYSHRVSHQYHWLRFRPKDLVNWSNSGAQDNWDPLSQRGSSNTGDNSVLFDFFEMWLKQTVKPFVQCLSLGKATYASARNNFLAQGGEAPLILVDHEVVSP